MAIFEFDDEAFIQLSNAKHAATGILPGDRNTVIRSSITIPGDDSMADMELSSRRMVMYRVTLTLRSRGVWREGTVLKQPGTRCQQYLNGSKWLQ